MDPLLNYHYMLRAGLPSGMPNMQYFAPHPYQMSMRAPGMDPGVYRPTRGVKVSVADMRKMNYRGGSPFNPYSGGGLLNAYSR